MDEPFGTGLANASPTGMASVTIPLRFPGQYYDAESGMHYNGNRDFIPGGGRFSQADPIGLAGGSMSLYQYSGANPVSRIDPTGLWSTTAHNQILTAFAAQMRLSPSQLSAMMAGSAAADAGKYQDAKHSFMHAMSSSDLSKSLSCGLAQNFVDKKVSEAVRDIAAFPKLEDPYWQLGFGLHAVMDSTSPAHRGFAYWTNWIAPIHGPFWTSWENSPTPAQIADNVRKMIDAMNGKFKFDCGCP